MHAVEQSNWMDFNGLGEDKESLFIALWLWFQLHKTICSVIFSDESTIAVLNKRIQTLRRRRGEESWSDRIRKIMVWGAISIHGTSRLFIVERTMNAKKYNVIVIFIYLPSDVTSQEKTATSFRSIIKASKYAIPLKPTHKLPESKRYLVTWWGDSEGPKGHLSLLPPHQVKVKKAASRFSQSAIFYDKKYYAKLKQSVAKICTLCTVYTQNSQSTCKENAKQH